MANNDKHILPAPTGGELIFYQTEDGQTRLQVRLEGETVWLTQKQLAELFQKDVRTINEQIQNVFQEGELSPESVIRKFRITAADGKFYETQHYNLDVIISVGYRVNLIAAHNSESGLLSGCGNTSSRVSRWTMNGSSRLAAAIISMSCWRASGTSDPRRRPSGARCWRFTPRALITIPARRCRANSSHGQTAAEVIHDRADAAKPNMGLTAWTGTRPRKTDVAVAKNYLTVE